MAFRPSGSDSARAAAGIPEQALLLAYEQETVVVTGCAAQTEPETYAAILDADRISCERFAGSGSALAQAYNHTILPLSSSRDKRTQILWGIADFVHRFKRRPEGMWLPETAVDLESLDILAEQGIRFTILAPHQARRTRRPGGRVQPARGHRVRAGADGHGRGLSLHELRPAVLRRPTYLSGPSPFRPGSPDGRRRTRSAGRSGRRLGCLLDPG